MVYPWEKIVKLCKKYGVLSLVDGAHSIGQHKVDVGETDCDFFVTVSLCVPTQKCVADLSELSQMAIEVSLKAT